MCRESFQAPQEETKRNHTETRVAGKADAWRSATEIVDSDPAYKWPRNDWRRLIHAEVLKVQRQSPVRYEVEDRLEVQCRLYLNNSALAHHDIDNRLKDILDALQGRAGGPKQKRTLDPIIPNDRQVYRVIIEKFPCRIGTNGWGVVTIRRLPKVNLRWRDAMQPFRIMELEQLGSG